MNQLFKKITALALSAAMMLSVSAISLAAESNQLLDMALWNANADQASMGNVATANNTQALYNPTTNTLQFATNPVDVSGYCSGIQELLYDTTGNGDFQSATILSTGTVETGTKNDGTNHTVTFLSSFEFSVPSYLTKQGVEYIAIKMSVPHTPMDVVVGTGYLDARIRLDWDSMTATTLTDLEPNIEISTGAVEDVTFSSNGVDLNAENTVVASDSVFTATPITSGSDYDAVAATLGVSDFDLYDISLTLGGEAFELTGTVNLILPYANIPSVYRINDDGSKTTLRGLSSADGYIISSRSLGLYAVVDGDPMEEASVATFNDVSESYWAYDAITNAVGQGLFNGTSDTAFSPEAQMTNGMVITVLFRMAGSPATANDGAVWYSEAMAWGYDNGIIGYTSFSGDANVSREGLATMLYYYEVLKASPIAGADLSSFSDSVSISSWAQEGLAWANAAGIVNGTSTTTISPQSQATRAQVATMLWRYVGA